MKDGDEMKEETKGNEILVIDCSKHPQVFEFMSKLPVDVWGHLTLQQAYDISICATAFHFRKIEEAIQAAKEATNCECGHDGLYDKAIDYIGDGQFKAICLRC